MHNILLFYMSRCQWNSLFSVKELIIIIHHYSTLHSAFFSWADTIVYGNGCLYFTNEDYLKLLIFDQELYLQ